jgi:hypothetical protein
MDLQNSVSSTTFINFQKISAEITAVAGPGTVSTLAQPELSDDEFDFDLDDDDEELPGLCGTWEYLGKKITCTVFNSVIEFVQEFAEGSPQVLMFNIRGNAENELDEIRASFGLGGITWEEISKQIAAALQQTVGLSTKAADSDESGDTDSNDG